jgi:hypothetical protein
MLRRRSGLSSPHRRNPPRDPGRFGHYTTIFDVMLVEFGPDLFNFSRIFVISLTVLLLSTHSSNLLSSASLCALE